MSKPYRPRVNSPVNPYKENVQGKANEPITVAGLLDQAKQWLGEEAKHIQPGWTLEEIYDRLEENCPRIAIIGGSADHPAHILDQYTVSRAALKIWLEGGVPFYFSTPVLCDGTAQSNMGMSYSLQSRNAIAEVVANQMEAHSYHGAFVIQGCDKQPLGVLSGLAMVDRTRRIRGEAPLFATFAPSHVLKGGEIPADLMSELHEVAERARKMGYPEIADDLLDASSFILQCSSNTAFQGVFLRAVEKGVITPEQHKDFEKRLAVNTCDAAGGICAFHGTGNSSRDITAGFGLVHPNLELLTEPPTQEQLNPAIESLFGIINRPECSVTELLKANIANAVRIHSAGGGSSNLMMHIVGAMLYAGYDFSLWDVRDIQQEYPIPDLFDYSLTEGRDIFVLAQQCCSGLIRGMETLFYELLNNGVPMDTDAMTVTGQTWAERLADTKGLSADNVKDNPIILSKPRRPFSGVDVLEGNFFESAVVKISGMPTHQLDKFDEKVSFVLYFENEDEANAQLLNVNLLDDLRQKKTFAHEHLLKMWAHNQPETFQNAQNLDYDSLFKRMVQEEILKIAVIIAGQGPEAYGMPEMFTPMQHINANRQLQKLATLISDGRYSGVSYGAAIGHMTPEAYQGGGILYLQEGDLLLLRFRAKRIELLDAEKFQEGQVELYQGDLETERAQLGEERKQRMRRRQKEVAPGNRLAGCTDAAHGVVPLVVKMDADIPYKRKANRSIKVT
ncbi:dihydroxyacid dehydratase/phosphogluconate dehydratase [Caldalkalibacillus uzonensis]|uniref:Dihydroxyacid dehydratase/phosphogluconate dehydratase n=1 Tax=Caldalkalibacillus uzonensis TaxID=353224 RepID=A0ABU0CS11_9BACI|nr:dihydroxy-acid dehydratase [Caldalkalibacillus uzonensis]MDQ0338295.1 dihydroxyacid dehydratase/phosphogluconate dehydratase [Caldalkalibacillus uzonensis]